MPTAAKLVAALIFAVIAYVAADQYAFVVPDGRPAGPLREVSALVGLLTGWFVMGDFVMKPRGTVEAMGTGVRCSVTLAFVVLVIYSIWEMLDRALDGRYKGLQDALLDIFARALAFGTPIFTPGVLGVLLLGGLMGGALAKFAADRWK